MPPSPNRSTTDPLFTRPRWFDRAVRRRQLAEPVAETGTATFGFRQMAEHEKPSAVMRHFDRVAPRYDLMNNLLSFGIQLVWKRVAVGEMKLGPGARVLAVWTAEHLLGIVPKHTHDWRRFIRPAELREMAEEAGLKYMNISGLRYVPYIHWCRLTKDTSINYLGHFRKLGKK